MNVLTLRLKTWHEARLLADELAGWTFRGQQDASWVLSTALQRGVQGPLASVLLTKLEEQIIEEFQRRAHHFVPVPPPLDDLVEWMALIQHYGGPTRLLDFTSSFYVAAFFAVEKASTECAIWCVNSYALFKAAVSLLGLSKDQETSLPYWQVSHRMGLLAQNLLRQKQNSVAQFIFEIQPFRLNERLSVQQGVCLCPLSVDVPFMQSLAATFGLPLSAFTDAQAQEYQAFSDSKMRVDEVAVIKVLLPLGIHADVLRDLWNMNITAATLFPGLDGFARSLHYFLRMESLWGIKYRSPM